MLLFAKKKSNFFVTLNSPKRFTSSHSSPYKILGIPENADESTVKNAYFKLSKQYHPDRNPDKNAQEVFIRIHNAYRQILEKIEEDFVKNEKFSDNDAEEDSQQFTRRSYSFTVEAIDVEVVEPKKFTETPEFALFSTVVVFGVITYFLFIYGIIPDFVDLADTYEDMQTTLKEDERKVIVDFQRQQLEEKRLVEELNEKRNYANDAIRQSFK